MTGRFLPSYQEKPKRRVIQSPKFYFFDLGIANYLLKRGRIERGSEIYGKAFEHFIYQEVFAHSSYSGLDYPVHFWRTTSQMEAATIHNPGRLGISLFCPGRCSLKDYGRVRSLNDRRFLGNSKSQNPNPK